MMKKGTRHDEIIGALFDWILKDIDASYFKAWSFEARDTREIDIACNDKPCRRHVFGQGHGDGSVSAAEFQTAVPLTNSQPINASEFKGIEQRRHESQTLFFPCQTVRQSISTHGFHSVEAVRKELYA